MGRPRPLERVTAQCARRSAFSAARRVKGGRSPAASAPLTRHAAHHARELGQAAQSGLPPSPSGGEDTLHSVFAMLRFLGDLSSISEVSQQVTA